MTCSHIPHEITVTHRRRRRVVSALFESRGEQFCNSDERIKHSLVQSSISTPFLRQLELFSGRSISEVGIDNDINIRRIANSISNLEGVSDNFDPIVAEKFHNEGRRLFVESIDFDQGVLSVLEVRKIGRHQERTVKELWGKVIQETVASGVASTFEAMNQSILTNNGKEIAAGGVLSKQEIDLVLFSIATFNGDENDYHNEYILKEMRKIVHQLEGIEEQLSFLKAHLNDKGEDEIRRYVFDKTLKLTKLNKMFLKVLLKNEKPTSKSHVAELKNFLERMPDIKDKNRLLDVMTRIVSLYKAAEIQDLRKWLLANIPFELIVLLIDNSKSMDVENMLEAVVDWCKEYIGKRDAADKC